MGKRSDTLETTVLSLELLRRIPRGRLVTAKELHEQLVQAGIQRDIRTIQRQLDMLSERFDLERDDRSKPYGYRWKKAAKALAVPNLTLSESLLLMLAEEHLRNLLPAHLMRSMKGFFTQARKNLDPLQPGALEREWPLKVRVVSTSQPLLPPMLAPGVFEAASEALYGNRWLHIDYRNASGQRRPAEIMPLGLAQQGPRLYLVCRFKGYDDTRMVALHRIVSARVSTIAFSRPKDFDLKRYDDEGNFGFSQGRQILLSFCIGKEEGAHLLETPLSADQQVIELDQAYEVKATVADTVMLDWWLRKFGDAVYLVQKTSVESKS